MKKDLKNHKNYIPSGILQTAEQAKYNCRSKFYPQPDGSLKLVEEMACNRFIFNPDGVELRHNERRELAEEYHEAMLELMHSTKPRVKPESTPEENILRSKRRAKNKLFDIICCNQFDWFVTLTLDRRKIDRKDYSAIIKKLNSYLDNRVRRAGLYYIGVPELHKDGSFHFHFLMNDVLKLDHSGTYVRPTGGKPVRADTVKRSGFKLSDCKDVYNISDWKLGFTTAIHTYGDIEAVANYVGKYITKGDKKVGGRWYYSGGKLQKPFFTYSRVNFGEFVGDYGFTCDGGAFLVRKDFSSLL
jgi:hypothetical protein